MKHPKSYKKGFKPMNYGLQCYHLKKRLQKMGYDDSIIEGIMDNTGDGEEFDENWDSIVNALESQNYPREALLQEGFTNYVEADYWDTGKPYKQKKYQIESEEYYDDWCESFMEVYDEFKSGKDCSDPTAIGCPNLDAVINACRCGDIEACDAENLIRESMLKDGISEGDIMDKDRFKGMEKEIVWGRSITEFKTEKALNKFLEPYQNIYIYTTPIDINVDQNYLTGTHDDDQPSGIVARFTFDRAMGYKYDGNVIIPAGTRFIVEYPPEIYKYPSPDTGIEATCGFEAVEPDISEVSDECSDTPTELRHHCIGYVHSYMAGYGGMEVIEGACACAADRACKDVAGIYEPFEMWDINYEDYFNFPLYYNKDDKLGPKITPAVEQYVKKLIKTKKGRDQINNTLYYTAGGAFRINKYLRFGSEACISKAEVKDLKKYISDFTEVIEGGPKVEATLYRGLIFSAQEHFDKFMSDIKVGDIYNNPAFFSHSYHKSTSDAYTKQGNVTMSNTPGGETTKMSVLITTESKNGFYFGGLPDAGQGEVVFKPGSKFEVMSIDDTEKLTEIHLKEITGMTDKDLLPGLYKRKITRQSSIDFVEDWEDEIFGYVQTKYGYAQNCHDSLSISCDITDHGEKPYTEELVKEILKQYPRWHIILEYSDQANFALDLCLNCEDNNINLTLDELTKLTGVYDYKNPNKVIIKDKITRKEIDKILADVPDDNVYAKLSKIDCDKTKGNYYHGIINDAIVSDACLCGAKDACDELEGGCEIELDLGDIPSFMQTDPTWCKPVNKFEKSALSYFTKIGETKKGKELINALKIYNSIGYLPANRYLRDPDNYNIAEKSLTKLKKNINTLLTELKTAPKVNHITYRGLDFVSDKNRDDYLENFDEDIFLNKGFLSTSFNKKEALYFAGQEDNVSNMGVFIDIKGVSGVSLYGAVPCISKDHGQQEVLFLPNTEFKVINIEEKGNLTYVSLEEKGYIKSGGKPVKKTPAVIVKKSSTKTVKPSTPKKPVKKTKPKEIPKAKGGEYVMVSSRLLTKNQLTKLKKEGELLVWRDGEEWLIEVSDIKYK